MTASSEDWRAVFHSPAGERVLLAIAAAAKLDQRLTTSDPYEIVRWQAHQDSARWIIGQAEMQLTLEPLPERKLNDGSDGRAGDGERGPDD